MTTILIKKKDTAGAPAAGDLTNAAGGAEIAVNTATKRIYSKDSGGTVIEMSTNPSILNIDNIQIDGSTISSTDANGNINLTPNGTGSVVISKLNVTGAITFDGNVTVGNSSSDTLTVNSTITSNLIFTDNTYDIGASGATRPRNLYLGNNITVGSLTSGRVTYAGASGLLSDSSTFLFDGTNLGVGVTSMAGVIDARTSTGAVVIAGRTSNVGTSSQPGAFAMYAPNASGSARVWGQWRAIVNTATGGSETSSLIFSQQNAGGLVDNLYLDQSQNMGLLAAPSAWWSGRKGLQIGDGSAPGNANFMMSPGTACYAEMSTNYYQSGVSGGTLNRLATGAVLHYGQNNGQHIWQIAPSAGTGVAPVFNQVLTLTTTGLGINQSSPSAVLHAVSPVSTSAGYFVIGSNNTTYGGGTSVSSIVKVGNSGGAQTGIAYYAGAPYDGSHSSGSYYPLYQYGVYVDDLYSYYGNNARAGRYNYGLYVKGGGFNYMQGTLGVSAEPSYWLSSQSAVQVYRATVACNTGGYVSFGNNWYQDFDTSADTAIVTGYVQRISLYNNQVLFQSANESATSGGGTSVTMTSRALFDNYGQLYNAASHTGYDASEYNIVDGNAIPYTLRKIGNYGNYQGGSSGLQIRGNLGVTGDPSYGYILLCNYTTGAQVDKYFFQGDIYFNRGAAGAGNNYTAVSIGCSTAYTSSNAGGVRIGGGGATVQIVYGTYGGVVYYFARFSGTNSSVYVTIDAIYVSGVTPQIIADGSVSAVTVVASL